MFASAASELLQAIMAKQATAADSSGRPPDRERLVALVNAALDAAVRRRFTADTAPTEITDFALTVRRRYPDQNTGPAILVEGVIRAALGEKHIMDGLWEGQDVPVKLLTAHAIVTDLNLNEQRYDQLIEQIVRQTDS